MSNNAILVNTCGLVLCLRSVYFLVFIFQVEVRT